MFLLICALDKDVSKKSIEKLVSKEKEVTQVTWLNGQNGKVKEVNNNPIVVGSISSMFRYAEQEVLLAKINGKSNVDKVVNKINDLSDNEGKLDYYVIQLVA